MEKKLSQTVQSLQQQYPEANLEVWAEDEHRLGLHPVNRMIWVPWSEVPTAAVNWKYEWLWLVGFVNPSTGQTYWWIVPFVNTSIFEQILADFAEHFGLGQTKRVLLVLDQATFHVTRKLTVPEGVHLLFLPPKSPQLQPAERLWPWTNEAIANQAWESLAELEEVTAHRCRMLMQRQEFVQGLTGFHWWMEAVS